MTDTSPVITDKDLDDLNTSTPDSPIEHTYIEYRDQLNALIQKIKETIYLDLEIAFAASSMISIHEVDIVMSPSFIFWEEEDIVLQTGRFLGMEEFKVKKDNDHFNFKEESGNGDRPYLELVRTPYGFAGLTYTGGLGMLDYLNLISISGDTGIIGIVPDSPYPDPLTGQEDFNFPKTAPEWYYYDDGRLTGVGRDGDSFDLKDSD